MLAIKKPLGDEEARRILAEIRAEPVEPDCIMYGPDEMEGVLNDYLSPEDAENTIAVINGEKKGP